jgi:hypothetical protein
VSRTTGRSAEVLRDGSGIKSTGQRALGSQSAHILRIPGMSHRKKTSRPDLSWRQAGQCVLAQDGDCNRTSSLSIRAAKKEIEGGLSTTNGRAVYAQELISLNDRT